MQTVMKQIVSRALVLVFAVAGAAFGSQVSSLSVAHQPNGTQVSIGVDGPIRFTHQTEIPKDGKPDRIIIDILDATHNLTQKVFSSLPASSVTTIRTSQYATMPEKIVRIVLDVKKTPVYKIESDARAVRVFITDAQVKPFPSWSTVVKETAPVLAGKPAAPAIGSSPSSAAVKNAQSEAERLASLQPATTPAAKPTSQAAPQPAGVKISTVNEPASASNKPAAPATPVAKNPVVAPKPADKPATVSGSEQSTVAAKPVAVDQKSSTAAPAEKPAPNPSGKPALDAHQQKSSAPQPTVSPASTANAMVVPRKDSTGRPVVDTHATSGPAAKPVTAPISTPTKSGTNGTKDQPLAPSMVKPVPSAAPGKLAERPAPASAPVASSVPVVKVDSSKANGISTSQSKPSSLIPAAIPTVAASPKSTSAITVPAKTDSAGKSTATPIPAASSTAPALAAKPAVSADAKSHASLPAPSAKPSASNAEVSKSDSPKAPAFHPPMAPNLPPAANASPSSHSDAATKPAAKETTKSLVTVPSVSSSPMSKPAGVDSHVSATEQKQLPFSTEKESLQASAAMKKDSVSIAAKSVMPGKAESVSVVQPKTTVKVDTAIEDESWAHEPAMAPSEVMGKGSAAQTDSMTDKKATSRFRRDAASAKMKGTMVAEFPQRLVIKYASKGNRDPFATLIDDTRVYNSPIEERVPNVEGLRLVGILESPELDGNRALFEDKDGYSYILESGDKVRNGYVLRVDKDQVFFQIFEYGWSRTLALRIDE